MSQAKMSSQIDLYYYCFQKGFIFDLFEETA
jgi:hypothetical protein